MSTASEDEVEYIPCPNCDGTGIVPGPELGGLVVGGITCPVCDGESVVEKEEEKTMSTTVHIYQNEHNFMPDDMEAATMMSSCAAFAITS